MNPLAVRKKLGRPCAVDPGETRKRLILEARRLFAEIGYDATTNRLVADAVGITTGAIYHYFPSKKDMYIAAYAEVQDMVYGALEAAVVSHDTFSGKFSSILDELANISTQEPSFIGFVVGVAAESQRHPELAQDLKSLRMRTVMFLHEICEEAVAKGEVNEGITGQVLHDMIDVVISGLSRFSHVVNDAQRRHDVVEGLKHLMAGSVLRVPVVR